MTQLPKIRRISILALREEGDGIVVFAFCIVDAISIHALREEGDCGYYYNKQQDNQFLSTPSARRATYYAKIGNILQFISIHALREEGDR